MQPEPVTRITRGGKHYKPPHLEANNPIEALMLQIQPTPVESDIVLKQLQKTQENISLWGLLMASYEHRQSLLKLLSCIQVPIDITLEALVGMVGSI